MSWGLPTEPLLPVVLVPAFQRLTQCVRHGAVFRHAGIVCPPLKTLSHWRRKFEINLHIIAAVVFSGRAGVVATFSAIVFHNCRKAPAGI